MSEREELNRPVIEEFRSAGGQVGGQFAGVRMLLLTCRGARTGQPRTVPLAYLPDGDTYVVFAANGGRDAEPSWLLNLRAHPRARVEAGEQTMDVAASVVSGPDRERLWQAQLAQQPWFAGFQQKTSREIAVVVLTPA